MKKQTPDYKIDDFTVGRINARLSKRNLKTINTMFPKIPDNYWKLFKVKTRFFGSLLAVTCGAYRLNRKRAEEEAIVIILPNKKRDKRLYAWAEKNKDRVHGEIEGYFMRKNEGLGFPPAPP